MSSNLLAIQPTHPAIFEDEIVALALQLEEIECFSDAHKGKYREENVPDMEVAFAAFQTEIQRHIQFLNDLKCAHSIARAVESDAQAIADVTQEEARGERDRRLALQMSDRDPDQDTPPPYVAVGPNTTNPEHEVKLRVPMVRIL
jgi:hypothetical protein